MPPRMHWPGPMSDAVDRLVRAAARSPPNGADRPNGGRCNQHWRAAAQATHRPDEPGLSRLGIRLIRRGDRFQG
jgi:hypothetical protein